MAAQDPLQTQRDAGPDVAAELAAAGFVEAKEIGRGGFGIVYRCREVALDRIVAVKVLTSDLGADNLERFLREQRAMGQLSGHPNIVNVLQVGATESGRPYLVMQYHPRDSLDALIRRSGPLHWHDALELGVKLSGALETAHRLGIAHRDVKPANILLTEFGEPQLTDFGIARIRGGFETATGEVTGSPAFTAPEILSGRTPTAASDVYSLAATVFCALTGHAAFERRSGERVVAQFVRLTTQPIPDLRQMESPTNCAPRSNRRCRWTRTPGRRPPPNSAKSCAPCRPSTGFASMISQWPEWRANPAECREQAVAQHHPLPFPRVDAHVHVVRAAGPPPHPPPQLGSVRRFLPGDSWRGGSC